MGFSRRGLFKFLGAGAAAAAAPALSAIPAPALVARDTLYDIIPSGGLVPLGSASHKWADLFLAEGSVIHFDPDITYITHSADNPFVDRLPD